MHYFPGREPARFSARRCKARNGRDIGLWVEGQARATVAARQVCPQGGCTGEVIPLIMPTEA